MRRDVLFGGGLLVAAGSAAALTPRRHVVLLGDNRDLESIVPKRFGNWNAVPSNTFVLPKPAEGSLADRLYNQTVTRLYQSSNNLSVMLVMAYGKIQNDLLQLHRPEICYSATGFQISDSRSTVVDLPGNVELPVRQLTATAEQRVEPIVYWTRIGDSLPTTGQQQRWVKLEQQLDGIVPDGILVRLSTVAASTETTFAALRQFAVAMLTAVAPADRPVLIGRSVAARFTSGPRTGA
jgi:EpsI family protein